MLGIDFNDAGHLAILGSERALLMYNRGLEVLFGCSYAFWRFPAQVITALANPDGASYGGGSFWLRRL